MAKWRKEQISAYRPIDRDDSQALIIKAENPKTKGV
jgi:hypothetical protein